MQDIFFKAIAIITTFLGCSVFAQQKIILCDELEQKNIGNAHFLFNDKRLKTDENGMIDKVLSKKNHTH